MLLAVAGCEVAEDLPCPGGDRKANAGRSQLRGKQRSRGYSVNILRMERARAVRRPLRCRTASP